MGNWRYLVNISEPLAKWEETGISATAASIYTALTASLPGDLADETVVWDFYVIGELMDNPGEDDFQQALDDLFDWGDDERVWIECFRAETPEWGGGA